MCTLLIYNTSAGQWARVKLFHCRITRHRGVFFYILSSVITVSHHVSSFFKLIIKKISITNVPLLKLGSMPICAHSPLPPLIEAHLHPSPPSGYPLPLLLAVKFTPPHPVVILNPPAGSQTNLWTGYMFIYFIFLQK